MRRPQKFAKYSPNFDYSTYSQKLGGDSAKFCGLLRIYELYAPELLRYILIKLF